MPIIDKTGEGPSITEAWRALELFANRVRETRLFGTYLNEDLPREKVLFFCGDGGNGKSLLIRYLSEKCTKRLRSENWAWIKSLPDADFRDNLEKAEGAERVPSVTLDFGAQPRGEDRPQEGFGGLLMLRRQLIQFGAFFPLFDFACLLYLKKTGGLSTDRLALLFPGERGGLLEDLVRSVSSVHWAAQAIVGLIEKRLGDSFAMYLARRKLREEEVVRLGRLDPNTELLDALPGLFAKDLNAFMGGGSAPERLVLFFDTHEAFWGDRRGMSDELYFARDEWLRALLVERDLHSGIVAVVAGRDPPRWSEATRFRIPGDFIDVNLIGALGTSDAESYLSKAGIEDPQIRSLLIRWSEIAPDQVHPLYLGLCADIFAAAGDRGVSLQPEQGATPPRDRAKVLVNRLLRYVDEEMGYAVRALCACRAFDRRLYARLGESIGFMVSNPAFEQLARFSFVWPSTTRGEGWYRIHDLLRRTLEDLNDDVTRKAHESLLEFYSVQKASRDNVSDVLEYLYHLNRTDWRRSAEEWLGLFRESARKDAYGFCRSLLDLRADLMVQGDLERGEIARSAAGVLNFLNRDADALEEVLNAAEAFGAAYQADRSPETLQLHIGMLRRVSDLQSRLGRLDYLATLKETFERARAGVIQHPHHAGLWLQVQSSSSALAREMKRQGETEEAISLLELALEALDRAESAGESALDLFFHGPEVFFTSKRTVVRIPNPGEGKGARMVAHIGRRYSGSAKRIANLLRRETLDDLADLKMELGEYWEAASILEELQSLEDDHLQNQLTVPAEDRPWSNEEQLAMAMSAHLTAVAEILTRLGKAKSGMSRLNEAEDHFKQALEAYDDYLSGSPFTGDAGKKTAHRMKSKIWLELSTIYEDTSRIDSAIQALTNASNEVESMRGDEEADLLNVAIEDKLKLLTDDRSFP